MWKERLLYALLALAALLVVAGIGYGSWRLERGCHYEFGYRAEVQAEVRALVKPECLK